ncbi:helix-turn-helix transcriptional regulator [Actinosynnema sp. NPDC049800]
MVKGSRANFGEQIRKMRKARDLSVHDVATRAGMTTERLTLFELSESPPPLGDLRQLADGLSLPLVELLIATGQVSVDDMPGLKSHLFAAYPDLPVTRLAAATEEVERVIASHRRGE